MLNSLAAIKTESEELKQKTFSNAKSWRQPEKKPDLSRKYYWQKRGEALKPVLKHWTVKPQGSVIIIQSSDAWQKCTPRKGFPIEELDKKTWQSGDCFILDFGETAVGRIRLNMHPAKGAHNDSPVRLRLIAGELPYEVDNDPDTYSGGLSRAWLQDETINFDNIPAEYILPRRYSLRYLKIELLSIPRCQLNFKEIEIIAEGVENYIPKPLAEWDQQLAAIDNAGLRTLRNCMQDFFEDGPKRDRRLWLGDLRLQALVNSVSYKRFDQVERSIWLLASAVFEDGMVPGAIMLFREPVGSSRVTDYALLFAALLYEHVKFSGNLEIGRELFELAVYQFSFLRPYIDQNHILRDPGKWWTFIDHCKPLNREMPLQGVYIYSLKALIELAQLLGEDARISQWQREAAAMTAAVRKYYFDPESCMVFSGPEKQKSSASVAWMIAAGVLSPEEGRIALRTLENTPEAILPNSPYLQHYVLNACFLCGENVKAEAMIRNYWGTMVNYGADTFWEIFRPGEDFFSPYGDVRNNSSCHAWSCTPSYFLRSSK